MYSFGLSGITAALLVSRRDSLVSVIQEKMKFLTLLASELKESELLLYAKMHN